MKPFAPSEMKTILHSKRANVYYLEHCRVLVKGGRVEYLTQQGKRGLYFNIPIANTTSILLGAGTSITQAAVRELSKAGVMVGFSGGGGTPLYSSTEGERDIAWLSPQSEYRPTEYLQAWVKFWFDAEKRLKAGKLLQDLRLENIKTKWLESKYLKILGYEPREEQLLTYLENAQADINNAQDSNGLLIAEARLTKNLFKLASQTTDYGSFTRSKRGSGTDPANRFLDHGNYLAYGLGATAAWVLGLPHGLAVMHGKSRRGGLVFDAADLIKDAVILPLSFISAMQGQDEREFRETCIESLTRNQCLDLIVDGLKQIALTMGGVRA
jgi:CRISPR-associated protein Cas1